MMTEGTQPPGVVGHRVVRKVPLHHLTQPRTLLRDRVVPDLMQLLLDTAQRWPECPLHGHCDQDK